MDVITLAAAKAAAKRTQAPIAGAQNRIVPVASRAQVTGAPSSGLSNGTDTSATYELQHTALATATALQVRHANVYNNSGVEADGPNDITVTGSLLIGNEFIPFTWNGQTSITIKPGAQVTSDPMAVDVTKGLVFYSRTYVSVVSVGMKWPVNFNTVSGNHEGSIVGSDTTLSGAVSGYATSAVGFGVAGILGRSAKSVNSSVIGIVGDSIAAGNGDIDLGYIVRALNNNYLYARAAQTSESPSRWNTQGQTRRQARSLEHVTDIIYQLGVNMQTANLQPYSANIWNRLAGRAYRIVVCTLTPQTTSTDAWATVGNQTIANATNEGFRTAYNDWIRAGAPLDPGTLAPVAIGTSGALLIGSSRHPVVGYYEVADLAESARNSGKWKAPGYTGDGTHPTTTAALALAPAVVPATYFTASV